MSCSVSRGAWHCDSNRAGLPGKATKLQCSAWQNCPATQEEEEEERATCICSISTSKISGVIRSAKDVLAALKSRRHCGITGFGRTRREVTAETGYKDVTGVWGEARVMQVTGILCFASIITFFIRWPFHFFSRGINSSPV